VQVGVIRLTQGRLQLFYALFLGIVFCLTSKAVFTDGETTEIFPRVASLKWFVCVNF
jgi:hypothetical protein